MDFCVKFWILTSLIILCFIITQNDFITQKILVISKTLKQQELSINESAYLINLINTGSLITHINSSGMINDTAKYIRPEYAFIRYECIENWMMSSMNKKQSNSVKNIFLKKKEPNFFDCLAAGKTGQLDLVKQIYESVPYAYEAFTTDFPQLSFKNILRYDPDVLDSLITGELILCKSIFCPLHNKSLLKYILDDKRSSLERKIANEWLMTNYVELNYTNLINYIPLTLNVKKCSNINIVGSLTAKNSKHYGFFNLVSNLYFSDFFSAIGTTEIICGLAYRAANITFEIQKNIRHSVFNFDLYNSIISGVIDYFSTTIPETKIITNSVLISKNFSYSYYNENVCEQELITLQNIILDISKYDHLSATYLANKLEVIYEYCFFCTSWYLILSKIVLLFILICEFKISIVFIVFVLSFGFYY